MEGAVTFRHRSSMTGTRLPETPQQGAATDGCHVATPIFELKSRISSA
jgi:hypothetical protein